jgi:predicted RND superfamily exporter protein
MAGGNLFGLFFNIFAFSAIWVFLSPAVVKLASVFAWAVGVLPTFQEAVTGFNTTLIIWGIIPGLAYIVFLLNYFRNEHSDSSQEV